MLELNPYEPTKYLYCETIHTSIHKFKVLQMVQFVYEFTIVGKCYKFKLLIFIMLITVYNLLTGCGIYNRRCDSGGCMRSSAWCDGYAHCYDASDEIGCSK